MLDLANDPKIQAFINANIARSISKLALQNPFPDVVGFVF
jgi:hypothetical protein